MIENKTLKALIIDDEQPARNRLRIMIDELEKEISIMGEASDGKEAIEMVRRKKPDLIFLDIQMPVLDGFDVVELLGDDCPPVIFVTAYDEYAIKAFEVHAVDYLLKPVRKERLAKSIRRIQKNSGSSAQSQSVKELILNRESTPQKRLQKIPVNYKQEIRLIDHDQILWFEADGKLTWVHMLKKKKYRCDFSLSDLEKRLAGTSFIRVHRSTIANLDHVEKLEPWFKGGYRLTLKSGEELDVARRRVAELKDRIGL